MTGRGKIAKSPTAGPAEIFDGARLIGRVERSAWGWEARSASGVIIGAFASADPARRAVVDADAATRGILGTSPVARVPE